MCRKKNSGCEKGQTLIEVVAALGIAVVVIGSILGLITANNRKATLARQDSQATKLVQEGLEIVRNIRDTDASEIQVGKDQVGSSGMPPGTPCSATHPCRFSDLYDPNHANPTPQGKLDAHLKSGIPFYSLVPNPHLDPFEGGLLGIFRRTVIIQDDFGSNPICSPGDATNPALMSDMVKRVTVKVAWDSPSGPQVKEASTCLTRWK